MANGTIAASQLEMLTQSGTGIITIVPPATNTNRTLTLPDSNGTILTTATAGVPINGPAFSAYKATSQTITNSVATKMVMDTEEFDTNSCFDSTTNYRFTPTVAGYYQVAVQLTPTTATTVAWAYIYKNGAAVKQNITFAANTGANVVATIYMNGSTDYLEFYGYLTGATPATVGGSAWTYFQAAMVRAA
jgi:hypothetical protein